MTCTGHIHCICEVCWETNWELVAEIEVSDEEVERIKENELQQKVLSSLQ